MTKVTINAKTTEKTYKAGDFFLVDGELSMLAQVDGNLYALIHVKSGNRWSRPITIKYMSYVTVDELNKMTSSGPIQYLESVNITY